MWSRLITSLQASRLLPWLVLAAGFAITYLVQQQAFNAARQIQLLPDEAIGFLNRV